MLCAKRDAAEAQLSAHKDLACAMGERPAGTGLRIGLGFVKKRGNCKAEMQVSFWHFIQLAGCEGQREQVRCVLKSSSGISEPVRVFRQWGGKREGGGGENMAKVIEYILRSNL